MQKPRDKCKIRAENAKADLFLKPLTVPLIKPCLIYYCSYVTVRAAPASIDSPFLNVLYVIPIHVPVGGDLLNGISWYKAIITHVAIIG